MRCWHSSVYLEKGMMCLWYSKSYVPYQIAWVLILHNSRSSTEFITSCVDTFPYYDERLSRISFHCIPLSLFSRIMSTGYNMETLLVVVNVDIWVYLWRRSRIGSDKVGNQGKNTSLQWTCSLFRVNGINVTFQVGLKVFGTEGVLCRQVTYSRTRKKFKQTLLCALENAWTTGMPGFNLLKCSTTI